MSQYTPEKPVAVSRYQNYFPTLPKDIRSDIYTTGIPCKYYHPNQQNQLQEVCNGSTPVLIEKVSTRKK
ncbi:MAG: hypothetical protein J5973_05320 [Eubacterium sp.]|nr:hypothetical protein [Eubacterium sp.]